MPIDPYIARGAQIPNPANTLAQIAAMRQRDAALAQDQQQQAMLQQKFQRDVANEEQADALWDEGLADIDSKDPARFESGLLKLEKVQPGASDAVLHARGLKGRTAATNSPFGNVNPGEFDPASIEAYKQTIDPTSGVGDFSVLKRVYAPPAVGIHTIGGVPTVTDPGNRLGGGVTRPLSTLQTEVDAASTRAGAEAGATAEAKATSEREAEVAKRIAGSANVNDALDIASTLIPLATGSTVGALADRAAGAFGFTPSGAEATASLRVVAAKVLENVPRMEGPQSDKDVQMYREAAGQLGDPTVTRAEKMAAIKTIRQLGAKYAQRQGGGAPGTPAPAGGRPVVKFGDL